MLHCFSRATMHATMFFVEQLLQGKFLWRSCVSKQNSAVSFTQIEPKLLWVILRQAKHCWTHVRFRTQSKKQKMLSRTRWHKNYYNLFSLQCFTLKLGRMPRNRYSNRLCEFYIFPIFGIGGINFQSQNTKKQPLFLGVYH